MVGADLIVYEADWARAKEGVKRYSEEVGLGVEMREGDDEKAVRPPWTSIHHQAYQLCAYNYIGPSEGVLLGMNTFVKLSDDRLSELVVP